MRGAWHTCASSVGESGRHRSCSRERGHADVPWRDERRAGLERIRKQAVVGEERLWLSWLNLSGDGQADLDVHGGPDKAVYAYPSEHLAAWADELGGLPGDAPFGENLSTLGVLGAMSASVTCGSGAQPRSR